MIFRKTVSDFIANAKTSNLPVGTIARFEGFTTSGDGGYGDWELTAVTGTPSQTPAQVGNALLNDADGRQWKFIGNALFVEQIGGNLDGVTDNTLVTLAFQEWSHTTGKTVYVGYGTYMTGSIVLTSKKLSIAGLSEKLSIVKEIANDNKNVIHLTGDGSAELIARDITFDGNMDNQTGGGHGIRSVGCTRFELHNVTVKNALNYGIGIQGGTNTGIKWRNLTINRTGNDGVDVKDYNYNNGIIDIVGFTCINHGEGNTLKPALDIRGEVNATNIKVVIAGDMIGVRYRKDDGSQGRAGFGNMSNILVVGDGVNASIACRLEGASGLSNVSNLTVKNCSQVVFQQSDASGGCISNIVATGIYGGDASSIGGSDLTINGFYMRAVSPAGRCMDIESTAVRPNISGINFQKSTGGETIRVVAGASNATIAGNIISGTLNNAGTGTDSARLRIL